MIWKWGKLFNMRVFGCVSYILIDFNNIDKLELKAKQCYFISYESDMYDYMGWQKKENHYKPKCYFLMKKWSIKASLQNP